MFINNTNRPVVIGIDHGFGNIKTAHTCFKTGVTVDFGLGATLARENSHGQTAF